MRIKADQLLDAIIRVLKAHGASAHQADATARHMVWCESVDQLMRLLI